MMTAPTKGSEPATDCFSVFGCAQLWVEMRRLEQKFLQLSWKLHPDNFCERNGTKSSFREAQLGIE